MIEEIKKILIGIDQTELENPEGWWETSAGAEFGANKLKQIAEALEQPEPEPVAWTDMAYARLGMVRDKMHPDDVATVQRFLEGDYTSPPKREPEPVIDKSAAIRIATSLGWTPQREWQGLTDEEKNVMTWGNDIYHILELAEAKLKEKNT